MVLTPAPRTVMVGEPSWLETDAATVGSSVGEVEKHTRTGEWQIRPFRNRAVGLRTYVSEVIIVAGNQPGDWKNVRLPWYRRPHVRVAVSVNDKPNIHKIEYCVLK